MDTLFLITIGALIGWGTNKVAIWMLFHPRQPIMVCGWKIQGLVPARRAAIAEAVAESIVKHLLNAEVLRKRLQGKVPYRVLKEILRTVRRTLSEQVAKLPTLVRALLPLSVVRDFRKSIIRTILRKADQGLQFSNPEDMDRMLKAVIIDSATQLDLDKFEAAILRVISRELRFIEYTGGILGALIGVAQSVIL